jgi:photosystem II stability/assembly factor-like uncharacterized protein
MKRLFILIGILLFIFQTTHAQFAWEWQNPKPQGNTLRDVFFNDTIIGYAVGDAGTLIKTTDGGNNWNRVYTGVWDALNSVYFTDSYNGYIAGERGRILKTIDAGGHWDSLATNTTKTLYSIVFVNNNTGYAVGDSGTILKTTNGGTTWQMLTSGTTNRLLSVSFIDENTGIVTGNNGTSLKTTNGGATWQSLTTGTTKVLNAVHMLDNNHVFICGNDGLFLKSENGGASFNDTTLFTYNYYYSLYDIKFLNPDTGFIVGKYFTKTTDGGNTWNTLGLEMNARLLFVSPQNNNFIYCVANFGSLFLSSNGGNSFSSKISILPTYYASRSNYVSIYFTDANTGYIACQIATDVMKTTDGGITWYPCHGGGLPDVYSYALHFPNKDTGYKVEYNTAYGISQMSKTTDAGETWSALFSGWNGIGDHLYAVFFTTGYKGLVAGEYGQIYKTTDGGTHWTSVTSGTTNSLNSIYFANDSIGYIVGSGGVILKTTDGGNSWSSLTSGTISTLNSIYFINSDTGFAVGNGILLKTFDGGLTWSSETYPFNLSSIHFPNANYGYVVGDGGKLLKTTDGGNTWNYMHSETTINLSGVFFTDSITGFIIGSAATLLKTTNGGMVNTKPVFLSNSSINIYPNPSSDFISINNNSEHATLQLFDINGKLILTKRLSANENKLDISTIKNGLYIAKIISPDNVKTTKIIKN